MATHCRLHRHCHRHRRCRRHRHCRRHRDCRRNLIWVLLGRLGDWSHEYVRRQNRLVARVTLLLRFAVALGRGRLKFKLIEMLGVGDHRRIVTTTMAINTWSITITNLVANKSSSEDHRMSNHRASNQNEGLWWTLEQPTSSLLYLHPVFASAAARLKLERAFLWMKSYGSHSPKGTVLWGNAPYLHDMARSLPRAELAADPDSQVTIRSLDHDGHERVQGGSDLKSTQAYPPRFGLVLALSHLEWCSSNAARDASMDSDCSDESDISCSCIDDILKTTPDSKP